MPTFTKHNQGTFCWIDLGTTDADAAKRFYGELLGWSFEDMPAGPDMTYSMAKLDGKDVGAVYAMDPRTGGPPRWMSYVAVDDVEDAARKVRDSGGNVVSAPMDVFDAGRMAVIQDPTGALLGLWQAGRHAGVGVKQEPGALCWNELFTTNQDAAGKFYVNVFGWRTEPFDMGPTGTYTLFKLPGEGKEKENVGGMLAMPPGMQGAPAHWLPYIEVTDCDASTSRSTELGAKTLVTPRDIPEVGRFSIVQDPTGAVLALYKNAH